MQVTVRDQFDNTATSYSTVVNVAIGANPPGNGVLDGPASATPVAGVATFASLDIDEAGNGYTLVASAALLAVADPPPR